jgi:hypothetical protein
MPAGTGYVVGVGRSSSQRVKSFGSFSLTNVGKFVNLASVDSGLSCGAFLTFDAGAGAALAVAYQDDVPTDADYTDTVQIDLNGSIYLHNVDPNKVWVARTAAGTTTVKYVIYV